MKRLIILFSLLFAFAVCQAQIIPASPPMRVIVAAGGGGSDTYGDCDNASADTYLLAGAYIVYLQVTVTTGGTVSAITTYCGADAGNATGLKAALYSDNADQPNTLLTNGTATPITLDWNQDNTLTFSTDPSVSDATKYWVAFKAEENNYLTEGVGAILTKYEDAAYGDAFPATATPSAYTARDMKVCITVNH